MLPENFLIKDSVAIDVSVQSKKRLLEQVAELFSVHTPHIETDHIFEKLVERERLGSTGLGQGIALPHARIDGLKQACAAFIRLNKGIDFDAIDHAPVDLIMALLVPSEANEEHLQILAGLAGFFSHPENCQKLRQTHHIPTLVESVINGVESSQQMLT